MGPIGDFLANTSLLWNVLLAILLLVVIWWAFRRENPEKASVESNWRACDVRKNSTDDLTVIEGIGPKVAGVLQDTGITTFDDLARAKVEDVQKVLAEAGLQMMNPGGWIEQAKLAARGDWDGLERLKGELKGGRRK